MKKMKKSLLWSTAFVLGASGAVAGVVAGIAANSTSIVNSTNNDNLVSGNNSSSSSVESSGNGSNSSNNTGSNSNVQKPSTNNGANKNPSTNVSGNTNTGASTNTNNKVDKLTITYLSKHVETESGVGNFVTIYAVGSSPLSNIKYSWYINRNDGSREWNLYQSGGRGSVGVNVPKTNVVLNWSFYCEVEDKTTGEKLKSDEVQFTIFPSDGRYIRVTQQPTENLSVEGGESVTLSTEAEIIGSKYQGKQIGFQWFKYEDSLGEYTEILGANNKTYKFESKYYNVDTTEKYLCRYYFKNNNSTNSKTYLNESHTSTIFVKATKAPTEKIEITSLSATPSTIHSGEKTKLSVEATSTLVGGKLKYQWYLFDSEKYEFTPIQDATSSTYEYTAEQVDKATKYTFMVMVKGVKYNLQSDNLVVQVLPKNSGGSTEIETPSDDLKVETHVYKNQAPVDDSFNLKNPAKRSWYDVTVTNAKLTDNLSYKWYYLDPFSGDKHLIVDATSSSLNLDGHNDLFKKIYDNNSRHSVPIMCEVYNNGKLSKRVDQSTDNGKHYKFYLTVGIVN